MFYLKELFLVGRDHKALIAANLLLLSLFLTSVQRGSEVRQFFSKDLKASVHPYFNALVSSAGGVNSEYISRKMGNLPGVAGVELKDSQRLQKDLQEFAQEMGEQASLLAGNYKAFKINLDQGIQLESRKLIKEYFSRLVGKKEVTFSVLKSPVSAPARENDAYGAFSKYADAYLSGVFAFGWFFTLWLLSSPIKAQAFLIQKFQRKERTALKIYGWSCALAVFAALAAGGLDRAIIFESLVAAGILMGAGSLFFIGKETHPRRFI